MLSKDKSERYALYAGMVAARGTFRRHEAKKVNKYGDVAKYPEWHFYIEMEEGDALLLEMLKKDIGTGSISRVNKPRRKPNTVARLGIYAMADHIEKTIPFFDQILIGAKRKEFLAWKKGLAEHHAKTKERRQIAGRKAWEVARQAARDELMRDLLASDRNPKI